MKLSLYPWQSDCLDAWSSHGCHGIVNVVTGAGKTIMALAAANRLSQNVTQPLRVKIVVPTTFLLTQWRNSILEFSDPAIVSRKDVGYCYGNRKDDPTGRNYMIYVINTARYCLARHILDDLKNGFAVLLIADECHHYASGENQKIFEFLPFLKQLPGTYYSLGLSATPRTYDYESVLIPALGNEIYRYGFTDAARNNTISRFALFQIGLSFDDGEQADYEDLSERITLVLRRLTAIRPSLKGLSGSQFFGTLRLLTQDKNPRISSLASTALTLTYRRKSLICCAKSRLFCTCSLIRALDSKAKIIIFGERIEQADQICALLEQQCPGQTGRCHSKMDKHARKTVLERYRNGEIRILVSCRALDEGYDIPAANVGIVLSSASIERQRIQRLGRILRRQEGKHISSLYYLYLENSVEKNTYFDNLPREAYSCSLSYCEQTDTFTFPEYEEAAVRVLQNLKPLCHKTASWKETLKCLTEGMVRPDWLLDEPVWDEKIRFADTVHEKNYWICMRLIGRNRCIKSP